MFSGTKSFPMELEKELERQFDYALDVEQSMESSSSIEHQINSIQQMLEDTRKFSMEEIQTLREQLNNLLQNMEQINVKSNNKFVRLEQRIKGLTNAIVQQEKNWKKETSELINGVETRFTERINSKFENSESPYTKYVNELKTFQESNVEYVKKELDIIRDQLSNHATGIGKDLSILDSKIDAKKDEIYHNMNYITIQVNQRMQTIQSELHHLYDLEDKCDDKWSEIEKREAEWQKRWAGLEQIIEEHKKEIEELKKQSQTSHQKRQCCIL
jgi:iron-sulfur cluster repair protein YtfE (RIC family)